MLLIKAMQYHSTHLQVSYFYQIFQSTFRPHKQINQLQISWKSLEQDSRCLSLATSKSVQAAKLSLFPHHSLQNLGIIPKHKLYLDPHIQDIFKYQNCHLQHLKHVSTTSQVFRGNLKTEIQPPLRYFFFVPTHTKRLGSKYIKTVVPMVQTKLSSSSLTLPQQIIQQLHRFDHKLLETTQFLFLIQNKLFRVKIAIHFDPIANPNMGEQCR